VTSPSDTGLDLGQYREVATRPLEAREPGWDLPIEHFSPSMLGMFNRCMEQFRHRYLLGERERPGEGAVVGSVVHISLEHNYRQKVTSGVDLPVAEVIEYLEDKALPEKLEKEGGADEIEWTTSLDTARDDARRVTSSYYGFVVPRIQPIAVEQKISVWPRQLPVEMIGYVDTETAERVIDVKTGARATTKVKPSWMTQGNFYALVQEKPVEFHTLSRAKTPTITTPAERGDDLVVYPPERERFFDQLGQLAQLIEWCFLTFGPDEPWPTTGAIGDWTQNKLPCEFCGWRSTCPAWA
jgi:PD-(D/E)XK nuclease superfamily